MNTPESALHKPRVLSGVNLFSRFRSHALGVGRPFVGLACTGLLGCSLAHILPVDITGMWGWGAVVSSLALLAGLHASWQRRRPRAVMVFVAMVLAWLMWAQSRVPEVSDLRFREGQSIEVLGWIEGLSRSANGRLRWHVRTDTGWIRVLAAEGAAEPGDQVRVRAVLFTPGRPVVPGAYDSAFHARFSGLLASGFRLESAIIGRETGFAADLVRLRYGLSAHIQRRLPDETGGIAAALLTGDRSALDRDVIEILRSGGLGHILAISGLHMALLAGTVYGVARLIGAAIRPFGRAFDARYPAILCALVAALAYLVLTGASLPTQRAVIMTACLLCAVLVSRRALSMNALGLACVMILILAPHSVLSVGFQMSFAATGALIRAYELARPVVQARRWPIIVALPGGVAFTSAIAGSATSVFSAFHFHHLAKTGFFANVLVMPIFSLIVMPIGFLALALIPLGWDGPVFEVMGFGLRLCLSLARWTSGGEGALIPIAAAPPWLLAVLSASAVWFLVARGMRALIAPGLVFVVSVIIWLASTPPNLAITDEGIVVAQEDGNLWTSHPRQGRFARRVFAERAAVSETPNPAPQRCDASGCVYSLGQIRIARPTDMSVWFEDCEQADILVLPQTLPDWRRQPCSARIIGVEERVAQGSLALWIRKDEIRDHVWVEDTRRYRIWAGDEERGRNSAQ